jgi:hypothetical protein
MLNERLQILVDAEQRRRLEREASRRGTSVGSLVREAIDAHLGTVTRAERLRALGTIRAARTGRFLSAEDLNALVEGERDEELDDLARKLQR